VGANGQHGLRRSTADKRRCIELLLRDEEWGARSDRWIAKKCGVDNKTVAAARARLSPGEEFPQLDERRGQDGKSYPVAHGRGEPSRPPADPTPRSSTRTTVEYDGEAGPEEPEWKPPSEEVGEDERRWREELAEEGLQPCPACGGDLGCDRCGE